MPSAGGQPIRSAAGQGPGITGKDILRIFLKRKWLVLLTFLTVLILVLAGTAFWWLYAPSYKAQAILRVSPPEVTAFKVSNVVTTQDTMDMLLKSKATIIKSEPVLLIATEDSRVTNTAWFQKNPVTAIERLQEDIKVLAMPGEVHILVEMSGTARNDKEKTDLAEIANAVAEAAVQFSRSNLKGLRGDDQSSIRNARDRLDSKSRLNKDDQARARKKASIPSLQNRQNFLSIQLQVKTTNLVQLQSQALDAITAKNTLLRQIADGSINSAPEVLRAQDIDGQLRVLRQSQAALKTQEISLKRKFGDGHRAMQDMTTRMQAVNDQVEDRELFISNQTVNMMKSSSETEYFKTTQKVLASQDDMAELMTKLRELETQVTRIGELEREELKLSNEMVILDQRLMDLGLLGDQELRLVIPAMPPREIDQPKWLMMIPLGVFLGLAFGVGLAFLLEFIDTSVKSPSDISRRMDLPLLGMVPHADDLDEDIEDLRTAFMTHPASMVSEAFRQIRTCLLFSGPANQRRTLLVTSPLPEDGRTMVTMNLAAAIAQDGKRVLVVDANFRQPACRELFPDCPDTGGLSSALVGQSDWRSSIYEVKPNLHILPSGILPPNPAELLGSDEMRRCLGEMSDQYDQVIIDGAPCLVVTDPAILSTLVDGVVLIVRAGANTHGIVQRARETLLRVGAHIVGVVLNGVRVTAGGYLRKNYETFYEYHERSLPPK